MEMSPIRTLSSRNNPVVKYFSGKDTDGKKVAYVISFHPNLRPSFDKSRE